MCPGVLLFSPSFLSNHAEREGKVDGVHLANLFGEDEELFYFTGKYRTLLDHYLLTIMYVDTLGRGLVEEATAIE